MAPKKDAVLGDAHKLFEKYSSKNGTHSGKLIKKQLTALMEAMQADQRFLFTSKVELTKWVDERFKEFDVDGNKALSLEEFVKFYRGFLCRSPEQVQAQLKKTQNEMERCFLLFDKNHDFALQKAELMQFMRSRVPSGLAAAVTDQQLSDLLDTMDFFGKYDVNKDGEIDFAEFCEGFNELVDQVNELVAQLRRKEMEAAGFGGLIKYQEGGADDVDMEELEEECKHRYTGKVWYAPLNELGGRREGGNVLERAREAGKIPILLKHPDQDLDNLSQYFSQRADATVLDVQQLVMDVAERTLGEDEAIETVRKSIVGAWGDGKILALRLNASAPELMLGWSKPTVLPSSSWKEVCHRPGQVHNDAAAMLRPKDGPIETFKIQPGYHLCFVSAFDMNNWKRYLRGKLPLGELQPVQVCGTLMQVAKVMKEGLPKDTMDDDLDQLDRLADML